jgi:hypothetical protein
VDTPEQILNVVQSEGFQPFKVLEVIHADWKDPALASLANDPAVHFSARINLHSVLAERQQQLTLRAVENWQRIDSGRK